MLMELSITKELLLSVFKKLYFFKNTGQFYYITKKHLTKKKTFNYKIPFPELFKTPLVSNI